MYDQLCIATEKHAVGSRRRQRERQSQLYPSEVMSILIHFPQSQYRTLKAYHTEHVQVHLSGEFPHLVSYPRCVALIPSVLVPRLS